MTCLSLCLLIYIIQFLFIYWPLTRRARSGKCSPSVWHANKSSILNRSSLLILPQTEHDFCRLFSAFASYYYTFPSTTTFPYYRHCPDIAMVGGHVCSLSLGIGQIKVRKLSFKWRLLRLQIILHLQCCYKLTNNSFVHVIYSCQMTMFPESHSFASNSVIVALHCTHSQLRNSQSMSCISLIILPPPYSEMTLPMWR